MTETKLRRRRHSADFKAQVLAECARPGASIAAVAMAHGINDNLVHKWRRKYARALQAPARLPITEAFIPIPVSAPAELRFELRSGAITANVSWPASSAAECALWLREVLR
jgi:transposase